MNGRHALLAATASLIAACGGGDGDEGAPSAVNDGWITVSGPSPATTMAPSANLTGKAFVSRTYFACCTGEASDTGVVVNWQNVTTGAAGGATQHPKYVLFLLVYVLDRKSQDWDAEVPLAIGSNEIVVTATDPGGNIGRATINVARGPDAAVPKVTNLPPGTGAWSALSPIGAPAPRAGHSAVWTGSELLVFGGWDNYASVTADGARYRPATDSWVPMATAGAPEPRGGHVAVWTGSRMLVWGGVQPGGQFLGSGASYDPATDSWSPLPADGAPTARADAVAIWTGVEMVVWGGRGGGLTGEALGDGARYSPATNAWAPISPVGAPSPRVLATAAWTGSDVVISGGVGGILFDTGVAPVMVRNDGALVTLSAVYDPVRDSWTLLSPVREAGGRFVQLEDLRQPTTSCEPLPGALAPRRDHTSTWTGTDLIVWGGRARSGTMLGDGARYRPDSATAKTAAGGCLL